MIAAPRPYTPQPGTIPAKFIEYLKAQPPGQAVSTAVVLDAIGQPELKSIRTYMLSAIGAGVVHCERQVGERGLMWSLGAGLSPAAGDTGLRDDHDEDTDLAAPPPVPNLAASSVFALAQATAVDVAERKVVDEITPATSAPASAASEFRCALFSDGQFLIQSGTIKALLSVDHTRKLLHYLDRIGADAQSAGVES